VWEIAKEKVVESKSERVEKMNGDWVSCKEHGIKGSLLIDMKQSRCSGV
jgi:hypothetical protein